MSDKEYEDKEMSALEEAIWNFRLYGQLSYEQIAQVCEDTAKAMRKIDEEGDMFEDWEDDE